MPDRARSFCVVPGCGVITPRRRCPPHAVAYEHTRPNYRERTWYRTPQWKALRRQLLIDQAYQCAVCRQITLRPEVDHIQKHLGDLARFWDRANLQLLCRACHQAKTRRGA